LPSFFYTKIKIKIKITYKSLSFFCKML
jgi:hypothetical protein